MAADISIMVGNTSPGVSDTIRSTDATHPNGQAVDLTGATVKLQMRLQSGTTLKTDAAASVTSAVNGQVAYQWVLADTDTAGVYAAWFRITFANGAIQDTPEFSVRVMAHAPVTAGYTTVAAVRDNLNLDPSNDFADQTMLDLILRYSRAVDDFCQTTFTYETNVTRRFRFYGRTLSFSRYGLSAATTVTLSPENSGGQVLVANTDYILLPFNKENGVYSSMQLSVLLVPAVLTSLNFGQGFQLVDILGAWGTQTVPPVVEGAVIRSVSNHVLRDLAKRTSAAPDDGSGSSPVFLPSDVRASLQSYRRYSY